jgi:hypothetical protein
MIACHKHHRLRSENSNWIWSKYCAIIRKTTRYLKTCFIDVPAHWVENPALIHLIIHRFYRVLEKKDEEEEEKAKQELLRKDGGPGLSSNAADSQIPTQSPSQ